MAAPDRGMATIDVDFEVYKALTAKRKAESDTFNDVLRRLLGLSLTASPAKNQLTASFVYKGVEFPDGTLFRATYKGQTHKAEIKNGAWVDAQGARQTSPSGAAIAITKSTVNGWTFWECRRPNESSWKPLKAFRS